MPAPSPTSPGLALFEGIKTQIEQINNWVRTASSVFVQLATRSETVLAFGAVREAGGLLYGSENFAVSKINTGEYEVKWTTAKTNANYVVLPAPGPISSGGDVAAIGRASWRGRV